MPASMSDIDTALTSVFSSATFFIATFSKPPKGGSHIRVVVSGARGTDGWQIRKESFTAKQAFTAPSGERIVNVLDSLQPLFTRGFRQALIQTPDADLHILRSADLAKATLKKGPASKTDWTSVAVDRVKPKALTPERDSALLIALDLATPDGKIKAAMADKYRQVNHLLTRWAPIGTHSVRIVDAGCGKAYLSLSLMYVLQRDGHEVFLHGIDANQHVVDHCTRVARDLGLVNARFTCARIGDLIANESCDLLIALHACDTATDEALALGIAMKAKAMLVAPCCHHEVQKQLRKELVPEYARPLLEDGITKERLGDLLTDTLRRDILRSLGYDAHLEEFIALEHTQKNILLRAVLHGSNSRDRVVWADRVRAMTQAWGAEPRLMSLVDLP